MLVYRIEDPETCEGCYVSIGYTNIHGEDRGRFVHPGPYDDGLGSYTCYSFRDHYRFGFDTPQKVFRWFTKNDLRVLDHHNQKLVVYEVAPKYVKASDKQCVFKHTATKKIASYDLSLISAKMLEENHSDDAIVT